MSFGQQLRTIGSMVVGVIGAMIGATVGAYCGIHMMIPMALMVVVGLIVAKIPTAPKPTALRGAWSVQGAHALWMAGGGVLTGAWLPVAPNVVLLAGGLAWLWARPGAGPAILLAVYQFLASAVNLYAFLQAEPGSVPHKALLVHLLIRAISIVLLIEGFRKSTMPARQDDTSEYVPADEAHVDGHDLADSGSPV